MANARLSLLPDVKLCHELKRPRSDGTSHVVFEPLELLEKWVALMRRVFMVDVLCCRVCGESMTLVSVLTDVEVVEPFVASLGLPAHPPQSAPA